MHERVSFPRIPLFDRMQDHSSVPTCTCNAVARSGGPGRPKGRRESALPCTVASTRACLLTIGSIAFFVAAIASRVGVTPASAGAEPLPASVQSPSPTQVDPFAKFVSEASKRFAIPEQWIRAVMQVESGNDPNAVSPKGAMGLMQIMPGTWAELRSQYNLGADPFDPHDSILAGAAYLREMRDRFGTAGFLAAYNAGPARYDEHLATGRPLPDETIAYVTALDAVIELGATNSSPATSKRLVLWRDAPLFVQKSRTSIDDRSAPRTLLRLYATGDVSALAPQSKGLFVQPEQ